MHILIGLAILIGVCAIFPRAVLIVGGIALIGFVAFLWAIIYQPLADHSCPGGYYYAGNWMCPPASQRIDASAPASLPAPAPSLERTDTSAPEDLGYGTGLPTPSDKALQELAPVNPSPLGK